MTTLELASLNLLNTGNYPNNKNTLKILEKRITN